jgi:hypothetical protein
MKRKMTGAAALTGFVILAAVGAHAQGLYNYAVPGGFDDFAGAPFAPNYGSYGRFYMSPGGGLYSGTVNTFSMDLGRGVSMDLVTSGPAAGFSGLSGSTLIPGFPSEPTTNSANGLYLNPALSTPYLLDADCPGTSLAAYQEYPVTDFTWDREAGSMIRRSQPSVPGFRSISVAAER